MDELTAMRSFHAERVKKSPTARDAARRELESRFEAAPASPGPAVASARRRRLAGEPGRLLAFARATATAAAASGIPPGWRRRGSRLALGAGIALVVAVALLVLDSGGDDGTQAFAVEPRDGGGVTIKVFSLADDSGLERALEEAGIEAQVTWLPAGMVCREPHYKPTVVRLPGGGTIGGMTMGGPGGAMTIGVGSTRRWRKGFGKHRRGELSKDELRDSIPNINLDPAAFRADQSVVLSGAPAPHGGDPEGGSVAKLGIAEGSVKPCEPVPAPPSGNGLFGSPSAGGGPAYVPRGDEALSRSAVVADLRQAANAAEAPPDAQVGAPPASGQFLHTKTKVVQLQGWEPEGPGAGSRATPRYFTANLLGPEGNALPALVPTLKEVWTAPDGTTRERETLGRIDFLSDEDQRRWEDAGAPPPFAYDPDEHDVDRSASGRLTKDYTSKAFRGRREFTYMSRLSRLPTEPEALRLAIENRDDGGSRVKPSPADSLRGGATVETLLGVLGEPLASPALRAAAFNALAEIPGIGLERDVADAAGRRGDAIGWVRGRGFGRRFIFNPRTSRLLSDAEVIFNAKAAEYPEVPDGTVFRETAYLESTLVDSTNRNRH